MPLYDFKCETCDHVEELRRPMDAPDVTDCPVCAYGRFTKQIGAPAFHLKGTGWFKPSASG